MIRIYLICSLLFYQNTTIAQTTILPEKVATSRIPKKIKYSGSPVETWKWKDSLGENWLILSTSENVVNENSGEQTKRLFAYHYCKKDTGYRVLWKLNDMIRECPVDITVAFIKGTTSITDLDKDGIAETTILYKLACRGDVSPANMKLIMHEDSVKYALRGSMWSPLTSDNPETAVLPVTEKDMNLETLPGYKGTDDEYYKEYGRYKTEKEFVKAPASFLSFARRQWLKYVKESFD